MNTFQHVGEKVTLLNTVQMKQQNYAKLASYPEGLGMRLMPNICLIKNFCSYWESWTMFHPEFEPTVGGYQVHPTTLPGTIIQNYVTTGRPHKGAGIVIMT